MNVPQLDLTFICIVVDLCYLLCKGELRSGAFRKYVLGYRWAFGSEFSALDTPGAVIEFLSCQCWRQIRILWSRDSDHPPKRTLFSSQQPTLILPSVRLMLQDKRVLLTSALAYSYMLLHLIHNQSFYPPIAEMKKHKLYLTKPNDNGTPAPAIIRSWQWFVQVMIFSTLPWTNSILGIVFSLLHNK